MSSCNFPLASIAVGGRRLAEPKNYRLLILRAKGRSHAAGGFTAYFGRIMRLSSDCGEESAAPFSRSKLPIDVRATSTCQAATVTFPSWRLAPALSAKPANDPQSVGRRRRSGRPRASQLNELATVPLVSAPAYIDRPPHERCLSSSSACATAGLIALCAQALATSTNQQPCARAIAPDALALSLGNLA